MEREKTSFQQSSAIEHFSHGHPLQLSQINSGNHDHKPSCCFACNKELSGGISVYACSSCNYFLHPECAELPRELRHPKHKKHRVVLTMKEAYGGLGFICDLCGKHGRKSWFYRCKPCCFELHAECALKIEADSPKKKSKVKSRNKKSGKSGSNDEEEEEDDELEEAIVEAVEQILDSL